MTQKSNEQQLLDLALSRGYLLARDLTELPTPTPSEHPPSSEEDSPRFGRRIDTLIQRGCIAVSVVEELSSEIQRTELAHTLNQHQTPQASPTSSSSSLFPVANWDKYQFLSRLGEGGMGVVYKAKDRKLGRLVALKFLTGSDSLQIQRFLQEARAQAQLDHPNICKIYEV